MTGTLANVKGTNAMYLVATEINRALEAIKGESSEYRMYGAILELTELAIRVPALVNQRLTDILEVVWIGLQDLKVGYVQLCGCAVRQLVHV